MKSKTAKNIRLILFVTAICVLIAQGCDNGTPIETQPQRPKNFEPFRYKYTIEQLYENFSEDMMIRASEDVNKLVEINEGGLYKPTLESLDTHPVPEWFEDAKLGIFLNWGPWSVAGYATPRDPNLGTGGSYPDWYEFLMDNAYKAYHDSVWGIDFRRDDLLPLLTGSNFDANEYIDLAVNAGAKYFVPFSRHHGGWTMWESRYTFRNAMEMGPGRDIYQEIADAARKKGMKLGLYFSVSEWECPVIVDKRVTQWDPTEHLAVFKDALGLFLQQSFPDNPQHILTGFFPPVMDRMNSGKIPVRNYYSDYMMPLLKEAVDRFDPDLLWYDGPGTTVENSRTIELSAYFYNQALGRKDVVINDRAGMFLSFSEMERAMELVQQGDNSKAIDIWAQTFRLGDYRTPEYQHGGSSESGKWEVCRSISPAFGYNWTDNEENSLTSEELIKMFIEIVAGNGNLLLVVNPDGSGELSTLQKNRLIDLGAWLAINGEGIYATRPWTVFQDLSNYFTQSKDGRFVYVHSTEWPGQVLNIRGISPVTDSEIIMLGVKEPLLWNQDGEDLQVLLPANLQDEINRPCKYAWTCKIQVK